MNSWSWKSKKETIFITPSLSSHELQVFSCFAEFIWRPSWIFGEIEILSELSLFIWNQSSDGPLNRHQNYYFSYMGRKVTMISIISDPEMAAILDLC